MCKTIQLHANLFCLLTFHCSYSYCAYWLCTINTKTTTENKWNSNWNSSNLLLYVMYINNQVIYFTNWPTWIKDRSPGACVCVVSYGAASLVSVSSVIISKRFLCGSRRFKASGSQPSHAVSLSLLRLILWCFSRLWLQRTDVTHLLWWTAPQSQMESDWSREITDLL